MLALNHPHPYNKLKTKSSMEKLHKAIAKVESHSNQMHADFESMNQICACFFSTFKQIFLFQNIGTVRLPTISIDACNAVCSYTKSVFCLNRCCNKYVIPWFVRFTPLRTLTHSLNELYMILLLLAATAIFHLLSFYLVIKYIRCAWPDECVPPTRSHFRKKQSPASKQTVLYVSVK